MARISYDEQTAAAYKAAREVPRDGLGAWREAVRRHLRPSAGQTLLDVGAGTGTFATAFCDWFGLDVVAVEPSAAMRAQIQPRPGLRVLAGEAAAIPLADESADAVWLSLVLHHVPDVAAAAAEFRRVLRPGAPVLMRMGFGDRVASERTFPWAFFPETARSVSTFPSLDETCRAFATAGFRREALEPVPEQLMSLAGFLDRVDELRQADTNMRGLTDEEYQRGRDRLARAVAEAGPAADAPLDNWLELLVLR
jgi:SAM-dependent methyltransferase